MIQYLILVVATIAFIAYYFNYNPLRKPEEVDTTDIEISINELKNLNQYIDNGTTNHTPI